MEMTASRASLMACIWLRKWSMLIFIAFRDLPVVKSWYPSTETWADLLIVSAGTAGSIAGSTGAGAGVASATISGTAASMATDGRAAGLIRSHEDRKNAVSDSIAGKIKGGMGRRLGGVIQNGT